MLTIAKSLILDVAQVSEYASAIYQQDANLKFIKVISESFNTVEYWIAIKNF